MDAESLSALLPELERFLCRFDDCFSRREQRSSLRTYVRGQLSDLPRKSIEPMALASGLPPRNLQQFLSLHKWDHDMLRDRLMQIIGREHHDPNAISIIDETYHAKKGDKTPGVQRQWCGTKGTTDNCAVTVHLTQAAGAFRCILDSELFLPEKTWHQDRERCRAAGIPDDMVYRPKPEIALELIDRARRNGVQLGWITFDAGYGMHSSFMHALEERGVLYVGEVPGHLTGWIKPPPVQLRDDPAGRRLTPGGVLLGRPRRLARPKVLPGDMHKAKSVENFASYSPSFTKQAWRTYHVKDDTGGPVVWKIKAAPFYTKKDYVPTWAHWLIYAVNPVSGEKKYFVSNAPAGMPVERMLPVAFGRWSVERCFQDAKSELGMGHFEVRNYQSLLRHMIITGISLLFLSRATAGRREKKPGADGVPGALGDGADDPVDARWQRGVADLLATP